MKIIILLLSLHVVAQADLGSEIDWRRMPARQVLISAGKWESVDDLPKLLNSGEFEEIPAKFTGSRIFLKVRVHREQYYFLMNFASDFGFELPYRPEYNFIKRNSVVTIDEYGRIYTCNNHPVWLNRTYYSAGINVSDRYRTPIVGRRFLLAFDWLIDGRGHRVFFRKNGISIASANTFVAQYAAGIREGKLYIVAKNQLASKWNVGDVVQSVNGQSVDQDNIAVLCRFLNEAPDWNSMDISVK